MYVIFATRESIFDISYLRNKELSYKSGLKCSLLIHIVQVFITCSTSMIFYIHVKVHVVNTFLLRIFSKKKIACNLQRDFIKSKLNYHVKC